MHTLRSLSPATRCVVWCCALPSTPRPTTAFAVVPPLRGSLFLVPRRGFCAATAQNIEANASANANLNAGDKTQIVLPSEAQISIRSCFIAQKINHRAAVLECFSNYPHRLLTKSSLVSIPITERATVPQRRAYEHQHMCILGYGSVVFFNCEESLIEEMLQKISKFSDTPVQSPHNESYQLVLRSSLDKWFSVGPDQILLQNFSVETIRTVTEVLGQTVALQYFEKQVESMLQQFAALNSEVAKQGEAFFAKSKTDLYKIIASNNKVLTDVVMTLNLLDRPETAWNFSIQSDLWDALRHEFDITDRFKALDFKINLVSQNCQFFLSVLHSTKSSRLEKIIIALIAFEVVIGLYSLATNRKH